MDRLGRAVYLSMEGSCHLTEESKNALLHVIEESRLNLVIEGSVLLAHHADLDLLGQDQGMGGHAVGEKDVCADGAACAHDRVAAHDGGAGIDGHVVFDGGMPFLAAQGLAAGQGTGDEADALVHFDVAAEVAGFADDGSGAVVHEEVGRCARPDAGPCRCGYGPIRS